VKNGESAGDSDTRDETQHEVTRLLHDMQRGDADAADALARKVYDALHLLALQHMRRERDDHTLQATVLVNEAFMRLVDQRAITWQNRSQFFALASRVMRRVLVDHARRKQAEKREGGVQVTLEDVAAPDQRVDILALDEALEQLATLDARQAQIVQLRFFGGLSIEDTAQTLGISSATVSRDWVFARAFLQRAMADDARPR
jgi:RNA polymerase sigma factor (TIGR02999 family)